MKMPKQVKNPMWIMLIVMCLLLINVVGYHVFKSYIRAKDLGERKHAPITVVTATVVYDLWPQKFDALGSLRAVQGIVVTTEVNGLVREVYFKANQQVKAGDLLVQLNADPDIGLLHSLQAAAKMAQITYERDKVQYEFNAVSKETLDMDEYNLQTQNALVEQQLAVVKQKTIRAPFDGKLGFSTLNPGEFLTAGDSIVSLQNMDSLYVDFYTPEQNLAHVAIGQTVTLLSDTYPGETFIGKLTAIDPLVDADTRNIKLEATIPNPKLALLPGMYARVEVTTGEPQRFLTIPQSAVSYSPYGNLVYIVQKNDQKPENDSQDEQNDNDSDEKDDNEDKNKNRLIAKQRFITLGVKRGDQVQVLKGLKEGDQIVAAGQLKIKNNSNIVINNKVVPNNDAHPKIGIAPEN